MPCIYKITNTITGNFYIGKTKNTAEERFESHKKRASKNANTILYKAMRAYGVESFTISVLAECSILELNELEIKYIDEMSPTYNMTRGGDGGSTTHNRKWVTNGVEDIYILAEDVLPVGYRYGRSNCVFNDPKAQKEFSSRSDREKAKTKFKETWKTKVLSAEEKQKLSDRMSGDRNPSKRADVKKKISKKQKETFKLKAERGEPIAAHLHKKIKCIHCGQEGIISNIKRWHNDNCRHKNEHVTHRETE